MDREKQIEEMAYEIETRLGYLKSTCYNAANVLYNAGYRKQSEGKWEKFEVEHFICSNCAKVFCLGSTATIYDVKRMWKYCPNCGARMDGGGK